MCSELKDFTGLSDDEFMKRMMRTGRFHYEGEHSFWNPGSVSELAWYYATSIDYLFANAIHEVYTGVVDEVAKKEYEPVLEYSGGVGSNALAIAQRGIRVHYFGIGMAEYHFTQYRIMKHGLEDLVNFTKPFSKNTGFRFDPMRTTPSGWVLGFHTRDGCARAYSQLPPNGSCKWLMDFDCVSYLSV